MPEVFRRSDHKRRLVVFVEGTQADQVRSAPVEPDPAGLGQSLHRYFLLDPLDLGFRYPRRPPSFRKPVKPKLPEKPD